MINAYDIAYGIGITLAAPIWLTSAATRAKVIRAFRQRMGDVSPLGTGGPVVMIHAVSLGEVNATRAMVRKLAEHRPDLRFVVSATTETGYARGRELYGTDPRVTVVHYPLDFTRAVRRVLDRLRPGVVVLMELEVWPNFVRQCQRRGIPIVLVNGRLTSGSFRKYRWAGPLVRKMFRRLADVAAQDSVYAERFIALGASPSRVRITGTMKFDTAEVADRIAGADELASAVGLGAGGEPVWVCGSTGPGEEQIILPIYRRLRERFANLRLVIVPRKPERFDEVAALIRAEGFDLVRRSKPIAPGASAGRAVVLGDTMGELRKFYSLADVVFVGRTLVDLGSRQHGSDMIEPAALARPIVIGPFTGNFAEVMNQFRAQDALLEVRSAEELQARIESLLTNPETASAMGRRAQEVVRQNQGATDRHVAIILRQLEPSPVFDPHPV